MFASIKRTFGFINQHPLAKRHLLKAYFNFFKWQLISRLTNKAVSLKFISTTKFVAKRQLTGITGNIYTGLHEFEDMSFLLHFLTKDDVFFDVGANVGAYTILASGVKKAKSVAFEPVPTTFEFLEKNVELNLLKDLIICKNVGVGDEVKTVYFTADHDTTNHIAINGEQSDVVEVEIMPLDSLYPHYRPSLMKIDVEGFETAVLKGAKQILNDTMLKAIIIELNGSGEKYGFDDKDIHQLLLDQKFRPFSYNPFNRTLQPLESFGAFNTIYIKDEALVSEKLKNSLYFKVFNENI